MKDHGKTQLRRLEDLLSVHEASVSSQAKPRIEPQRVVVIQSNSAVARPSIETERANDRSHGFERGAARGRHTAEAWAAGASVGAKTELRRLSDIDMQPVKAASNTRQRPERDKSSPSIVIPKLPAAAQLALLKERLSQLPQQLLDRKRLFIASTLLIAIVLVPLIPRALRSATPAQQEPEHVVTAAPTAPLIKPAMKSAAEEEREPPTAPPAQPAPPLTAANNVSPRAAVDALIAGNPQLAAERYQALARSQPDRLEFAAAARILAESAERAAHSGIDP